jgi:hypothetical protein
MESSDFVVGERGDKFGDFYYSDTIATPKAVHLKRCRFSAFLILLAVKTTIDLTVDMNS